MSKKQLNKKSTSSKTDKKKRGRKSKYDTHVLPNLKRIPKWRRDGLTEEQVAKKLGIAVSTFSEYKLKYSELMEALKKGKEDLIEELEDSLYKRAMGYNYTETKEEYENGGLTKRTTTVKHITPDTGALIFALKNLKPNKWSNSDRVEIVNPESAKEDSLLATTLYELKNDKGAFAEDEEYLDE